MALMAPKSWIGGGHDDFLFFFFDRGMCMYIFAYLYIHIHIHIHFTPPCQRKCWTHLAGHAVPRVPDPISVGMADHRQLSGLRAATLDRGDLRMPRYPTSTKYQIFSVQPPPSLPPVDSCKGLHRAWAEAARR